MPQLDNSLPPGLAGFMATRQFNQNADTANLNQMSGITGILAKLQSAQMDQELRAALASGDPKRLAKIPGGLEILNKLATMKNTDITGQLHTAQIGKINREAGIADQEQRAKGALANLMSGSGSFGQGTDMERPGAQVFPNDAEAIRAMQAAEASGQPFTGNVPNPGNVRALTLAAGNAIPRGASAELLKQLGPQKPAALPAPFNLSPGQTRYGPDGKPIVSLPDRPSPSTTRLVPVPDPNDPSKAVFGTPAEGGAAFAPIKAGALSIMGGRESVFLNRVLTASNQVEKDLKNIVETPISSSRGIFGGRLQGSSLFEAGKETLATKMTTQEVQSYNVLATGIQRNLAAIEAAGLAPPNSLMHMMDAVIFKEGDSNFTKLQKLAQTRQIVEAGLETILANPRVSESQKDHAEKLLEGIRKAVPFSGRELLKLGTLQQTNPNAKLSDVMKEEKAKSETGPEWSSEKEQRYQELLRKRGGS